MKAEVRIDIECPHDATSHEFSTDRRQIENLLSHEMKEVATPEDVCSYHDVFPLARGIIEPLAHVNVGLSYVIMDQRHARGIPEYAEQHGVRSFKFFIGNAARIFGLWPRKGSVAPGADADLTLIDLKKRRVVRAEDLITSADFTPYEGMELRGWPVLTLLRGRVIMREGQPVGEPSGEYLWRNANE